MGEGVAESRGFARRLPVAGAKYGRRWDPAARTARLHDRLTELQVDEAPDILPEASNFDPD